MKLLNISLFSHLNWQKIKSYPSRIKLKQEHKPREVRENWPWGTCPSFVTNIFDFDRYVGWRSQKNRLELPQSG